MKNETEMAYAEVDAILDLLETEVVEKIPLKVREFFKNEKDKNYKPTINRELLVSQNIELKKETISILTLLEINYWCVNEEERQFIINQLSENDRIKEKELRERYNPDNLFKNRNNKVVDEQMAMVEYKERTIIRKILDKILNFFNRKNYNK